MRCGCKIYFVAVYVHSAISFWAALWGRKMGYSTTRLIIEKCSATLWIYLILSDNKACIWSRITDFRNLYDIWDVFKSSITINIRVCISLVHAWWNVIILYCLFYATRECRPINPETNAWYITNEDRAEDIHQACHIHDTLSQGKTFTETLA